MTTEIESDEKLDRFRSQLNEDFKQHIGVLYEKFHSDVQLVAEQVSSVDRKIDTVNTSLRQDMALMREDISLMGQNVSSLDSKVFSLIQQQIETDRKADLLIETVGTIAVDITDIKEELDKKANRADYPSFEHRA